MRREGSPHTFTRLVPALTWVVSPGRSRCKITELLTDGAMVTSNGGGLSNKLDDPSARSSCHNSTSGVHQKDSDGVNTKGKRSAHNRCQTHAEAELGGKPRYSKRASHGKPKAFPHGGA